MLDQAARGAQAEDVEWVYPDRRMVVMAFDENHLFYRLLGELVYKNGGYCWCPSRYFEQTGTLTAGLVYYPVAGDPFIK